MKKVLILFLTVVAVLVAGVVLLGTIASPLDTNGKIILFLDKTELYKGQRTISYTIINNSGDTISFGAPYDIQIKHNGEWVSAEWMKDLAWIMILYVLESGKSFSAILELPEDIEPGTYRLVKEVMIEDSGDKIVLTA